MPRLKPNLHVVNSAAPELDPETELAKLVPLLISGEREVAALRFLVGAHRIALAKKRKLTFIRDEAVRREFGK